MIRKYITYRVVLLRHCKYTAFILSTKEKGKKFLKFLLCCSVWVVDVKKYPVIGWITGYIKLFPEQKR